MNRIVFALLACVTLAGVVLIAALPAAMPVGMACSALAAPEAPGEVAGAVVASVIATGTVVTGTLVTGTVVGGTVVAGTVVAGTALAGTALAGPGPATAVRRLRDFRWWPGAPRGRGVTAASGPVARTSRFGDHQRRPRNNPSRMPVSSDVRNITASSHRPDAARLTRARCPVRRCHGTSPMRGQ